MPTIDEKRVYTDNSGVETVFLAAELGVVAVSVSDDLIGEFGVVHRCRARDVATAGALVAVATDEDVLLADRSAADESDDTEESGDAEAGAAVANDRDLDFAATGFGPATAVGFDGDTLLAGDDEGRVEMGAVKGSDAAWADVGTAAPVRAIDGRLVAAADGAYRVGSAGLTHAGLDDARDVDAEPLVATGSGLYKLGNGWMDVLDGPVDAVDAAGKRGLAVRDGILYERAGTDDAEIGRVETGDTENGRAGTGDTDGDDTWAESPLPIDGDVVAVTHGVDASYAVTAEGTIAVRLPGEEWRHRELGVRDVAAAAV
ncbi:HVO_0234 family beta-propeller protein [Halobellus salinisoli]|uniref:HVO_0234 family beta-propeller protein n=1 Tax=Halobellus salinisoli TaxID=3108500 RepID=UPI0030091736